MTRALPKEEREKIVLAYNNELATAVELAKIFNIAERTVYKYLRQLKETGDLAPYKQPGRPPIITDSILDIINNIVSNNPDGTLDDYKTILEKETGISVTIVTIHNACKELDLRRKKKVSLLKSKNVKILKKKG